MLKHTGRIAPKAVMVSECRTSRLFESSEQCEQCVCTVCEARCTCCSMFGLCGHYYVGQATLVHEMCLVSEHLTSAQHIFNTVTAVRHARANFLMHAVGDSKVGVRPRLHGTLSST